MRYLIVTTLLISVAAISSASAQNRTFSSCEEARDAYERQSKDKNTMAAYKACKATGQWVGPQTGRVFKIQK